MPEGHSVHRIARQFECNFLNKPVAVTSPQGRFSVDAELINGRTLVSSAAVGKQLFLGFENELWLRVHLGIYGAWDFAGEVRIHPDIEIHGAGEFAAVDESAEDSVTSIGAPRKTRLRMAEQDRVRSEAEKAQAVSWPPEPVGQVRARLLTDSVCADLRGPTVCEVIDGEAVKRVLDRLGPDPANDNSQAAKARFVERAHKKATPIGLVLMDQAVVAGIGNVYRAELLFRAGLNPHTPAKQLPPEILQELWDDWAKLLDIGIRVGQMITIDGLTGSAYEQALINRDDRHWVYKKEQSPCARCGTNIVLEEFGARKLYWCPGCQK
ncbi:Fpg/Nei family DNA glycosylase [Leucobacter sp. OH1287]|uniref:Fpg/Nei family DNA glycosylase n=1 Tax=Leucobacter sp. OH1287 TaxID=2491049 RepID=UPI000F603E43|nr:DNA-formamidopyrimidine glycosylase family protein [Leucobacter sp. OH1287]RRD60249.1 Fpg/Nei family DNA glycosylase [Leucobacter sp. OH1287]